MKTNRKDARPDPVRLKEPLAKPYIFVYVLDKFLVIASAVVDKGEWRFGQSKLPLEERDGFLRYMRRDGYKVPDAPVARKTLAQKLVPIICLPPGGKLDVAVDVAATLMAETKKALEAEARPS